MYNNIGKKIKGLALASFIVVSIISVLAGLFMFIEDEDMAGIAMLVILVCPLIAWVSSWVLYGFGELVDKACDIERNTRGASSPVAPSSPVAQASTSVIDKLDDLRAKGLITEAEYQQALSKQQYQEGL